MKDERAAAQKCLDDFDALMEQADAQMQYGLGMISALNRNADGSPFDRWWGVKGNRHNIREMLKRITASEHRQATDEVERLKSVIEEKDRQLLEHQYCRHQLAVTKDEVDRAEHDRSEAYASLRRAQHSYDAGMLILCNALVAIRDSANTPNAGPWCETARIAIERWNDFEKTRGGKDE